MSVVPLNLIRQYAGKEATATSFRGLIHHGKRPRDGFVARNLQNELCIRLGQQVQRIEKFPQQSHHLKRLLRVHTDTFQELQDISRVAHRISYTSRLDSLQHQNCDPLDEFRRCIDGVNNRHAANVETLMEAKRDMQTQGVLGLGGREEMQVLMDDFLRMHISFQLLCRHFLLSLKVTGSSSGRIGMVAEECLLQDIINDAVGEAQLITEHHLEHSPDVLLEGDMGVKVCCVPSHVHHVLFEVLKNAMRAASLKHRKLRDMLPPVCVRIAKGEGEVSVRISDEGGGMTMDTARNAFQYLWTSSEAYGEVDAKHRENASFQPAPDPLCGMGIGLPVSRWYARHFGGDLRLLSMHGYGTYVVLYLPSKNNAQEHLPSRP